MVVDVDRLQAVGPLGELEGLDHALVAVERTGEEVGVDVLVLVGRVDLEVGALLDAQRRHVRHRVQRIGGQRLAAVDRQHAGLRQHGQCLFARVGVAAPLQQHHRLAGRGEPGLDVLDRALDLALRVEAVAGQVERVALAEAALLDVPPLEGVREGVRADLDVGQREHAPRDALHLGRQLRVEAGGRRFALDDRHRGRHPVALQHLAQQHLAGQRRAHQIAAVGEAVAVDVDQQQPPAGFGGRVGHRHGGQRQRAAQEGDRVDHPAVGGLARGQPHHVVARQRIAAPGRVGHGVHQLAAAIAGLQQQLGAGRRGQCGEIELAGNRRDLEADRGGLLAEDDRRHGGGLVLAAQHPVGVAQHGGVAQARFPECGHLDARRDGAAQPRGHGGPGPVDHEQRDDPRDLARPHRGQLPFVRVDELGHQPEVIRRRADEAQCARVGQLRRIGADGRVVQDQQPPRQHLDRPHAHRVQLRRRHPGHEAVRADAPGGLAGQGALGGGDVVDGQHRQAVLRAHLVELAEQPGAVRITDGPVAHRGLVPAAVERLGGDHVDVLRHLRQDLEAAVGDHLGLRECGLERLDHAHQTGFLRGAFLGRLRHELVGVERVEEEAAVALLPLRAGHMLDEPGRPLGRALVDHCAVPGLVAAHQPGGRHRIVLRMLPVDFAHRQVGHEAGARGRLRAGGDVAVVAGLQHDPVERGQLVPRGFCPVVHGHAGSGHSRLGHRNAAQP